MPYLDKLKQLKYQSEWRLKRRAAYFEGKVCVRCGGCDRLELDHINPEDKISHSIWSWSEVRRLAELAKCQPLCYVCHKQKTNEDFNQGYIEHGTLGRGYKNGCRCAECKLANTLYKRNERLIKKLRSCSPIAEAHALEA